jgi:hypothetical protein
MTRTAVIVMWLFIGIAGIGGYAMGQAPKPELLWSDPPAPTIDWTEPVTLYRYDAKEKATVPFAEIGLRADGVVVWRKVVKP